MTSKYSVTPEQAAAMQSPKEEKFKKKEADPRFFRPAVKDPKKKDDSRPEEYNALVRILPRGTDFTKPYNIDVSEHFFDESGVYFSGKCRKTLGKNEECPVCDDNWNAWNLYKKTNNLLIKTKTTPRFSKTTHICNILVVKDIIHPENDGKVMLWKIPNTIYDKILEASNPNKKVKTTSAFEESVNSEAEPTFYPYDPSSAFNLIVSVTRDPKKNMVSYEASKWYKVQDGPKPLAADDAGIEKILNECNDLVEFISDVPSIDKMKRDFDGFNERVKKAQNSSGSEGSVDAFAGSLPSDTNTSPNIREVPKGDSKEFWGGNAPSASPSAPSPVNTSVDTSLPEDDLPF